MEEQRLKINLELHVVGDGRTFLNFWNHINGDDVVVEVVKSRLYDDEEEISVETFIDRVKKSMTNAIANKK